LNTVVFTGQGSILEEKAENWDLSYSPVQEIYRIAKNETGVDVLGALDGSPEEKIRNQQVIVYTTQMATYFLVTGRLKVNDHLTLRMGLHSDQPDLLGGFSMGEYGALTAGGAFDFETGLRIIKKRNDLMAQGKGTFVRKDSPANELTLAELQSVLAAERIIELTELREILECNAVKLAAERANSEDIQRIRGALERMKACKEDLKHFYGPDFDFHVAIAEATHNEMICEMMKLIVEKSHEYYEKFMPERLCPPEQAILTAEQMVAALMKGEGEKASRYMKEHLDLVEIELKRVVDAQ